MMPLARRASLVVSLLLLTSVGTASAECAWVLWESIHHDNRSTVVRSDEGRGRVRKTAGLHRGSEAIVPGVGCSPDTATTLVENPGRSWFRKRPDGGDIILQNRCLPDTIDPRGPKGK